MRSASRRVGRKGERRALAVRGLTVPPGMPAVMDDEPLVSETDVYVCLRRAAIVGSGVVADGGGRRESRRNGNGRLVTTTCVLRREGCSSCD